jgi:hypothetical protein
MIVTDSLARLEKRGEEFLLQCARGGGSFGFRQLRKLVSHLRRFGISR